MKLVRCMAHRPIFEVWSIGRMLAAGFTAEVALRLARRRVMEAIGERHASRIRANVRDYHAEVISYEEFRRRAEALWAAVDRYPALSEAVRRAL